MGHKYGAKKKEIDGIIFDSQAEARRYCELMLLKRAGEIKNLVLQPEYLLQESFKYNGKTEKAIKYKADFAYIDKTDKSIVEDVKGVKTEAYKIKRKLFLKLYGKYFDFREVS